MYAGCLFLLKSYINLGNFDTVFLLRIGIIVLGSWGVIFLAERIYIFFFPSITKRIVEQVSTEESFKNSDLKPVEIGRNSHKPLIPAEELKNVNYALE